MVSDRHKLQILYYIVFIKIINIIFKLPVSQYKHSFQGLAIQQLLHVFDAIIILRIFI